MRRLRLRNLVLLGEDPPLGTVFASSHAGMTVEDVIKAWSVVEFLVDRGPRSFSRFALLLTAADVAMALELAYALDVEGFDEAWRRHVIEHG